MVVVLTEILNCEFGLLKHNRISPHVETSGAHSKVDSSVKITTPEPQLEIIPDKTAIGTHNKVDSSVKIDTHALQLQETQLEINPNITAIPCSILIFPVIRTFYLFAANTRLGV